MAHVPNILPDVVALRRGARHGGALRLAHELGVQVVLAELWRCRDATSVVQSRRRESRALSLVTLTEFLVCGLELLVYAA